MTDARAIDQATLVALLEATGGDPAFLVELIDAYCDDALQLLAAMQQAAATSNAPELRRAAHSMKSNSASFGAKGLAKLCEEIEERAKAGALDGVGAVIEEAVAAYPAVAGALRAARS